MPILIKHPKHGKMHVYSIAELERHNEMGWELVKDTPDMSGQCPPCPANVSENVRETKAETINHAPLKRPPGRPRKVQ
jgi:hypothetical protein